MSQKASIENKPAEIYCLLLGVTTHDRLNFSIEKGAIERFINQRIQYEKSELMAIN
ncbi:hypothetical protein [Photorhabdus namnaonensis]|uniref:hypothetical protein n=1 Tax=Photorhabdus namnaonensis TaxID=1851568 RepID=UPI000A9A053D